MRGDDDGNERCPDAASLLVEVQLWYQPIAYRWVENLRTYKAAEPQRFVGYFGEMSAASALMLTRAVRTISEP